MFLQCSNTKLAGKAFCGVHNEYSAGPPFGTVASPKGEALKRCMLRMDEEKARQKEEQTTELYTERWSQWQVDLDGTVGALG